MIKKLHFYFSVILLACCCCHVSVAQTNVALTATADHSGGGTTTYGPSNYNDNVITTFSTCGGTAPTPWGWLTTTSTLAPNWIEYTWTAATTVSKVVFYMADRPSYGSTIQYWNGTAYVTIMNYTSTNCPLDSVSFTPVTTTKLRFYNIITNTALNAASYNPNFREIKVFGPTISFTQQPISATICPGISTSFTAIAATPVTYQWQYNTGTTWVNVPANTTYSGVTTNTLNIAATTVGMNGYQYRCAVTDTAYTVNSSIAILTVPNNTVSVYTTQPTPVTAVCSGLSTSIITASTGSSTTYQWQVNTGSGFTNVTNGGVYGGATTNTLILSTVPIGYNNYVYRNIASQLCVASTTSTSDSLKVTQSPDTSVTVTGPTTVCGGTIGLNAVTNAAYSYQWKLNGTVIPGATAVGYQAAATGSYTATVAQAGGCTATSLGHVVTVNPVPAGVITSSSPLNFCEGGAVVLNTYTAAGYRYQWYKNNILSVGDTNMFYIAGTPGSYTVQLKNGFNCVGTTPAAVVTTNPTPVPPIYRSHDTMSTGVYSSYQWYYNQQPITGATNRIYITNVDGPYNVAVVDPLTCTGISPVLYINTTGIAEVKPESVSVYPNPASDVLHVSAPVKLTLDLRNLQGQIILHKDNGNDMSVSDIADGIYMLAITDKNGNLVKMQKVVKMVR